MTALTLPRPGATLLTDDDRAVILMLAEGQPLKRIARAFATTAPAVGMWTERLVRRTGTENRVHLVATALRCGWLDRAERSVAA